MGFIFTTNVAVFVLVAVGVNIILGVLVLVNTEIVFVDVTYTIGVWVLVNITLFVAVTVNVEVFVDIIPLIVFVIVTVEDNLKSGYLGIVGEYSFSVQPIKKEIKIKLHITSTFLPDFSALVSSNPKRIVYL